MTNIIHSTTIEEVTFVHSCSEKNRCLKTQHFDLFAPIVLLKTIRALIETLSSRQPVLLRTKSTQIYTWCYHKPNLVELPPCKISNPSYEVGDLKLCHFPRDSIYWKMNNHITEFDHRALSFNLVIVPWKEACPTLHFQPCLGIVVIAGRRQKVWYPLSHVSHTSILLSSPGCLFKYREKQQR